MLPAAQASSSQTSLSPHARRHRRVHRHFDRQKIGGYSFPRSVADQLAAFLEPFRNYDAAWRLAKFIGRYHAGQRLNGCFPLTLDQLAQDETLGLTVAQIRGAIKALTRIGYIDDVPLTGSTHRQVNGRVINKAKLYCIGGEFRPLFAAAKAHAAKFSRRKLASRQEVVRPADPSRCAVGANSQEDTSFARKTYLPARKPLVTLPRVSEVSPRGSNPPQRERISHPETEQSPLEAALARLRDAIKAEEHEA